MDKRIFFLIGFIFLLGLVSASYNVEILAPFDAPEITVTNVSGGAWAAGTYKFVAVAGEYYNGIDFWNPGVRTSASSNIEEITIVDGDSIFINYSSLDADAPRIYFHALKITGSVEYWDNIGTSTTYSKGYIIDDFPENVTITDDNLMKNRNTIIEKFENDTPYNLNISKGICAINVTSIGGDIDISNVISTLETDASPLVQGDDIITYGTTQLITTCSVIFAPASGYQTNFIQGQQLTSYGGFVFDGEIDSFIRAGKFVVLHNLRRGGYGRTINIKTGDIDGFFIDMLNERYTVGNIYYGEESGAGIEVGKAVTGYGTIIGTSWFNPAPSLTEFYLKGYALNMYTANERIDNQRLYSFVQPGKAFNTSIHNSEMSSTYHYRTINYHNGIAYSLDNTFLDITTREVLKFPVLSVLQYTSGTHPNSNASIFVGSTLGIKVRNNTANVNFSIENANVSVYDKDNNLTFTQLTDENGSVSQPVYWGRLVSFDTGSSGVRDDNKNVTDLNPFRITITADNYGDYEGIFELYEKQTIKINLEDRDWNYSNIPEWKILNNSKHTILKINSDGDLAIAGNIYESTNSPPAGKNILWSWNSIMWLDNLGNLYLNKLYELIS